MSNPQYQHQHRIINSLKNALSQHRPNQKQPPPLSTTPKSTSNPKQKPFKSHTSLQTTRIIFININKHNSTPKQQIINNINTLIESKPSHLVAIFKDFMIADFIDEFLRREYHIKECFERLPKFANYYKNYLTFFCKPTFSNFYCNHIVQSFGEAKAEIYYNNNYGKNSKPKKKVTMIGDGLKPLFSSTVKEEIENNNSFVTANNDVCEDTEVNNTNNNIHSNNNNNKCNDNTISLTMDNSNSRMFIKATNSKNNKKHKLNINTNTNIHFCYPECLTFNSNIIGKRASTESSLASILDMFTQFPTSHNNNINNNINANNAINNKNQQQQNQTSLKPKSKPKPTIDMSNIGGNHKHRSRNPPITDRLQISKTQTIPSNTNTDLNNPSNTNTKQQITNPSTNNTRFTSDKQHHTVYSNNSSKRTKYSHKISTLKQTNQLTIQTSTNANINSLCKKNIPYTTRNKSNEYNTNTHNHNNNINNNNNNNKTSNKKTQNTNMNLKNKFKLSTNPPLHLKTMSSNFQSSINTYNKIIKQTTTSNNNNNNNNNNTLSSPKMKKSLNKVSFNSNKHIPTSPGSNTRSNTHNNNNNKELFSPSNMNLDSIMKLTLKLYHSKDNNAPVSKIHHARCNSSTNNRDTISTPTINNFNININNHICFNNNHSNNSNNDTTGMKPTKANNGKVNIQNLLDINKNNNILSRNNVESVKKDTVLARTNTENNGNKKGYVITMNSPTNGQGVIIRSHNRRLSNGLVYEKKKTSRFLTQRGGSNGGSSSSNNNNHGNKLVFGYGKSDFGFLKK